VQKEPVPPILLVRKMILSQRMHSRSGGVAHIPRTNRVTNSVFIVFAELALLQWVQTLYVLVSQAAAGTVDSNYETGAPSMQHKQKSLEGH